MKSYEVLGERNTDKFGSLKVWNLSNEWTDIGATIREGSCHCDFIWSVHITTGVHAKEVIDKQ